MSKLGVVLLAAGQGTRMRSKKQKILHPVAGKPMVRHVFEVAATLADVKPVIVIAPGERGVPELLGDAADYAVQAEALGTGHAAAQATSLLQGRVDQVLITYGDMPLLRAETLSQLAQHQASSGAAIALLSVLGPIESTFGRVVRNPYGQVAEIVEVAEARQRPGGDMILSIRELNVGVYCFRADWLWPNLSELPMRQARSGHEYYLTDLVARAVIQDEVVQAVPVPDSDEGLSAGTRAELAVVERAFRRRVNQRWLASGVTLADPETTYIEPEVTIGQDTIILPQSHLQGRTVIGADCVIGPMVVIRDSQLGDRCQVSQSTLEGATVGDGQVVGPYAHLKGDMP
jgi:bifunctional UDP-N-acetylglucosamine pyrophosphorylase/glucosamine-1-phosphate N-acetyltransferase